MFEDKGHPLPANNPMQTELIASQRAPFRFRSDAISPLFRSADSPDKGVLKLMRVI